MVLFYVLYASAILFVLKRRVDLKSLFTVGVLVYASPLLIGYAAYPSTRGVLFYTFSPRVYEFYSTLICLCLLIFSALSLSQSRPSRLETMPAVSTRAEKNTTAIGQSWSSASNLFLISLMGLAIFTLVMSIFTDDFSGVLQDKVEVLAKATRLTAYFDSAAMVLLGSAILHWRVSEDGLNRRLNRSALLLGLGLSSLIVSNGFRTPLLVGIAAAVCAFCYGRKIKFNLQTVLGTIVSMFLILFIKDYLSAWREERELTFEQLEMNFILNEFAMVGIVIDQILEREIVIGTDRIAEYILAIVGIFFPSLFEFRSTYDFYAGFLPEITYGITSGAFVDFFIAGGWFAFFIFSAFVVGLIGVLDAVFRSSLRRKQFFKLLVTFFIFLAMLNSLRSDLIMTITLAKRFLYVIVLAYLPCLLHRIPPQRV